MVADSIAELLDRATAPAARRTAIDVPGGRSWTYDELRYRIGQLAAALHAHGTQPGDRVLTQVDKSADAVALYLACLRRGLVFTPINPACPPAEVDALVAAAAPGLVVAPPGREPAGRGSVVTLGTNGDGTLAATAAELEPELELVARGPDDLAALLFTSGTTGTPKAAMITNANLVANSRALFEIWHWQADDVLLHVLPLFHVHGLFVALHCSLLGASPIVLLPRFDLTTVLEALPRVTVMMGVPTHYSRLLGDRRLSASRCRNVRLFTSGSAPMTEPVHAEFTERTGHRIVERYGMTETGILTSNPYHGDRLPGSVGYPLPDVELRVMAADGQPCRPGDAGTIEVRGPNVFAGYWQRDDATAEAFGPHGWFITGDVGSQDASGRVRLEGRTGDMIISGGENIYPKEVELVLDEIDGVRESAVIGIADADYGEVVAAVLVPETDPVPDATLDAAVGAGLAPHKRPKRYVWADALPRNTMGKVQKHVLRNELAT